MLETAAVEKKIPPPLPPKTRRGCPKNSDGSGGATILQSNGHVVKIRIDRPIVADGGERDDEPSPRDQHLIGRRSSTVKINITCVDPFVYRYNGVDDDDVDDDDEDDHDIVAAHGRRRSLSGHSSPLDSGTGSDLDTGSRRDESDDGTCSCDSLTSGSSTAETPVVVKTAPVASTAMDTAAAVVAAAVAAVVAADTAAVVPNVASDVTKTDVVATTAVATVVEEPPKHPSPPTIRVQQGCYGDTANATAITANRVIDLNNTDQYYSFHMNENVFDDVDAGTATKTQTADGDDTFAGCKTVVANGRASDTIRSAKGTIRGVKNRVRAGIATFLQPKTSKVSSTILYNVYISKSEVFLNFYCKNAYVSRLKFQIWLSMGVCHTLSSKIIKIFKYPVLKFQ